MVRLAERSSRFDRETVRKLKTPITPEQAKKLLAVTTPLLGPPSLILKPRVVIVGMDGLDHQYLDPLIRKGTLPNFKKLMEEGTKGTLLSALPPNSAGSWPSMVTGCNPGKTNLLNFRTFDPAIHEIVLTDGRTLKRPALWDILGAYGKKSIAINEPMSYPPHKIKGIMISGILASEGKIFTYPETLSAILNEIGYKREATTKGRGFFAPQSTALKDFLLTERKRLELLLLLMERNDWDLLFCMFPSTDRMMHGLGRYFTRDDLDRNLLEMDRILGSLLEKLPEGAVLLVVSDHGFDSFERQFSIPRWLAEEGYWALPAEGASQKTPLFRTIKFLKKLKERMPLPDIPFLKWPRSLQRNVLQPPADWERTVAISVESGGNWGSIRILDPKKPVGHLEAHWGIGYRKLLKKEISEKLSLLEDPETREKVVKKILEREALFNGPYQEEMPDLVFELSRVKADYSMNDRVFRREPEYHHRQEGVLFAWGKNIRRGEISPAPQGVDITPTVLYLLGLPIAEDLDGKILIELFDPPSASRPPYSVPRYEVKEPEWVGVSGKEAVPSGDVQENLRSLGYLQ